MTSSANSPVSVNAVTPSRELLLGPNGEVEIKVSASDLRLSGVDGDRVTIRVPGGREIDSGIAIDQLPGRVRIRDAERGYRLGPIRIWTHQPPAIEIDVPRDARVTLQTLSGAVVATGIAGESRWATASGDLRLDLDGGPIGVESMSGDVTLRASIATRVVAHAVSGDLRLWAPRFEDLVASTTSGDVSVVAALGSGADHRLTSVSGDVELVTPSPVRVRTETITGDVRGSGKVVGEGGRGHRNLVVGDGSVRVTIRTTSGDIGLRTEAAAASGGSPGRSDSPDTTGEPGSPATEPGSPAEPGSQTLAPAHAAAPEPPTFIAEAEAAPNLVRREATAADHLEAARLEILRALERGELDVEAASRRLETLEEVGASHD